MYSWRIKPCPEFTRYSLILNMNSMHFAYLMAGLRYRVEGNLEIPKTFFLGIDNLFFHSLRHIVMDSCKHRIFTKIAYFCVFFASLEYCHGYFCKPSKFVYNWVPFMFLLQKRLLVQARVRNLHPAKLVNDFYVY